MKRNFFKYMLLGAFTLALGVGFVGCKDYDDDVDELDKRIAALEGAGGSLAELRAEIANKADKTAVDAAIDAAKLEMIDEAEALIDAAMEDLDVAKLQALAAKLEALNLQLEGLDADQLAYYTELLRLQEAALVKYGFTDDEEKASWDAAMAALKASYDVLGDLTPEQLAQLNKLIDAVEDGLGILGGGLSTLTFDPQVTTPAGDDGIKFRTYYYQQQEEIKATGRLGDYVNGYHGNDYDVKAPATAPATFADWRKLWVFKTSRPTVHYAMNSRLIAESDINAADIFFGYREKSVRSMELADMDPNSITAEFVGIEDGDLMVKIGAPGENIQHYAGFYHEFFGWKHNNATGDWNGDRKTAEEANLPRWGSIGVIDGEDDTYGDNALDSLDMVQLNVPLANDEEEIVTSDWATMYTYWMPDFQILHKGKTRNSYYGEQVPAFAAATGIKDLNGRKPVSGDYAYATVRYWDDAVASYDADNAKVEGADALFDENWTYTLNYPAKYGFPAYTALNNTITNGQLYNNAEWYGAADARSPEYHAWQPDTVLYVGRDIDLRGVVRAGVLRGEPYYAPEFADIDIEEFGFRWEFEALDYMIGNTNQKDFVALNGSVAKSVVFDQTDEGAGVGRTPLFRVKIMDGDKVVKTAYIKVEIVRPPVQERITIPIPTYLLDCNGVDSTTVYQMNTLVYNYLKMPKEVFHTDYTFFVKTDAPTDVDGDGRLDDGYFVAGDVGTVDQIVITETTGEDRGTTYLLEWSLSPQEMYDNMGKDIKNEVKYVSKSGGSEVVIVLTSHIDFPVVDIVQADTYEPFWSRTNPNSTPAQGVPAGTDFFMQNTAVPHSAADNAYANNTFTNNIYSGFVTYLEGTWNADGQLWGANKWGKVNQTNEDPSYMPDDVYTKYKNFFDNLQVHYFFKAEENTRDFVADGKTFKLTVEDGKDKYGLIAAHATLSTIPIAELAGKVLYATLGNETQIIAQIAPVNTKASKEASAAVYPAAAWNDAAAIMGNGNNGVGTKAKLYYSLQYGDFNTPDANGPDNGAKNDFADIILNTDEFAAYIESEGWMCGNAERVIDITGDYADFWVKFIRPVDIADNNGYWIDADNGYSWIRASDVIKLIDWREYSFDVWNADRTVNENANLYGFYGTDWTKLVPDFATAKISQDGVGGQTINGVNLAYATASEILRDGGAENIYHPAFDKDAGAVANIPGDVRAHYRIDGLTANYPAAYTDPNAADDGTPETYYFGYRNVGQPVSRDWYVTFNAKLSYNWGELPILVKIKLHPSAWAPAQ